MRLYDISETYADFLRRLESGEIPEEAVADTLEGLDGVFEEKADNIACLIKELTTDAVAIKAEKQALEERQKQKERQAESLKNYLSTAMQQIGKDKLETPRNRLSFRKSTRLCLDENAFLEALTQEQRTAYLKYTAPAINKTAVTTALKSGEEIAGAHLETAQNLQIK